MANELELKTADTYTTVSLDKLAGLINEGHEKLHSGARRMAIHVAQVGAWLTAAKDKCEHGDWLPWLAKKCPEITDRTARKYMALYRKVEPNRNLSSDLLPTQAYKM